MNQELCKPLHISDWSMIKSHFLLKIRKLRNTDYVLTHFKKGIYIKIWISKEWVGSVNNLPEAERLFKTPYLKPKENLCQGQEHMTLNKNFWWLMTKQKRMWKREGGQHCSVFWRVNKYQSKTWSLISFLPSNLHSTFFLHKNYPEGKKFPGLFEADTYMPCTQSVWCLQQNVLPGSYGW